MDVKLISVDRPGKTLGKNLLSHFDRVKEVFLFDVTAEVVMKDIPKNLIINWGLVIRPWRKKELRLCQ